MHSSILLSIQMPAPGCGYSKKGATVSIEDKVRQAIELVDSGYSSSVEWILLNKLLDSLRNRKPSKRVQNLISMIEPVMAKYGYHGTSSTEGKDQRHGG